MKLTMGKNIRKYRRELGLTQEQLAEAVGVTVGAVSKWESDLSNPDIGLLPELADLFGISVDVLLGYQLSNRTAELSSTRIHDLRISKNYEEGRAEADKALQRYPNCFDVVYQSAVLFHMIGVEKNDRTALHRSLELYRRACDLISQNTDPSVSELAFQVSIGEVYVALGDIEHALQHLKKYNYCGINDGMIGLLLSQSQRCDEALSFLSENLINCVMKLFQTTIGLSGCFDSKGDSKSAFEVLMWMYGVLEGLKYPGKVTYLDKAEIMLLLGCAQVAAIANDIDKAEEYLRRSRTAARAYDTARTFGSIPNYDVRNIKFYHGKAQAIGDNFGETAMGGIEKALASDERTGQVLTKIWRKIKNEEK